METRGPGFRVIGNRHTFRNETSSPSRRDGTKVGQVVDRESGGHSRASMAILPNLLTA